MRQPSLEPERQAANALDPSAVPTSSFRSAPGFSTTTSPPTSAAGTPTPPTYQRQRPTTNRRGRVTPTVCPALTLDHPGGGTRPPVARVLRRIAIPIRET